MNVSDEAVQVAECCENMVECIYSVPTVHHPTTSAETNLLILMEQVLIDWSRQLLNQCNDDVEVHHCVSVLMNRIVIGADRRRDTFSFTRHFDPLIFIYKQLIQLMKIYRSKCLV